jgi:hypothetical protein
MQPFDITQGWQSIASLTCNYAIITPVSGIMPDQCRRFVTADKWQTVAVNYREVDLRAKVAD